mgnify:CR=1 FL=1
MEHFNITIFGDVQGVYLRRTLEKEANRIGVFGFVKNEKDGTVYLEIEGKPEAIKNFIDWIKKVAGEGVYKILQVETLKGTYRAFDRFEIR